LEFFEVVVHPIESVVPRLLVPRKPLVEGPRVIGFQAVASAASLRPAADESDLVEHPQVLRNLRLGHGKVRHERSDRLLARDQRVQDVAAARLGDGVEDIGISILASVAA
jgi:hypothetical protein